jgi:hypothetical protein
MTALRWWVEGSFYFPASTFLLLTSRFRLWPFCQVQKVRPKGQRYSFLPRPESHSGVQFCLVLLGANAFLANVDVITPAAAIQVGLFTHGSAGGTSLQHLGDDVPGVLAPDVHDFQFFSDLLEIVVAQHTLSPRFLLKLDANQMPHCIAPQNLTSADSVTNLDSKKWLRKE